MAGFTPLGFNPMRRATVKAPIVLNTFAHRLMNAAPSALHHPLRRTNLRSTSARTSTGASAQQPDHRAQESQQEQEFHVSPHSTATLHQSEEA